MATSKKTEKLAKSLAPQPFYVIAGKDRRRAIDSLHHLVEQLLGDADPQLAMTNYDGGEAKLSEVLTDLNTLPFLSDYRLVVVKDADDFISQYRQALEDYQQNPSSTGILILQAESFPKTTRLAKAINKNGAFIDCSPVAAKELPVFLTDYAKKTYGLIMSERSARFLIEMIGDESGILCGEIDKIATFLADPQAPGTQITEDIILQLSGHNRQYTVFNVIDSMVSGQTRKALELLDAMMRLDREAEFSAVGAFAWHVRRLYRARILMDDRTNDAEILKKAGVWHNTREFLQQVRKLNIKKIAQALKRLAEIDYGQKTGGCSVKDGLEKFIVEFSSISVR